MNAEQKDILKYGEALGILKERKSLMRFTEGFKECGDYHGEPRIMYGVEDAIRDAWQKRAACRAWVNIYKRNCENCKYFSRNETEEPCVECSELYEGTPEYWEPRKEEQDND